MLIWACPHFGIQRSRPLLVTQFCNIYIYMTALFYTLSIGYGIIPYPSPLPAPLVRSPGAIRALVFLGCNCIRTFCSGFARVRHAWLLPCEALTAAHDRESCSLPPARKEPPFSPSRGRLAPSLSSQHASPARKERPCSLHTRAARRSASSSLLPPSRRIPSSGEEGTARQRTALLLPHPFREPLAAPAHSADPCPSRCAYSVRTPPCSLPSPLARRRRCPTRSRPRASWPSSSAAGPSTSPSSSPHSPSPSPHPTH